MRDNATRFLERKLKLQVNMEKTEARRAIGSSFLGFTFIGNKGKGPHCISIPQAKKLKKLEDRIRLLTKRNRAVSVSTVIAQLNKMLTGRIGYVATSSMKTYLQNLMGWIGRRVRLFQWEQW